MSFEYDWTFKLNQKITERSSSANAAKSFLWELLSFLTTNGWSYDGTCNSVVVSATNNISTLDDIVCNTSGSNARSWIILKSPEGIIAGLDGSYLGDQSRIWVTFDCQSSNTNELGFYSRYSLGKPTGGTTTISPTHYSMIAVYGNATFYQRTVLSDGNAVSPTLWYHFAITKQGHFWAAITGIITNTLRFVMAIFPMTNVCKYRGKDFPYAVCFYQTFCPVGNVEPNFSEYVFKYWNQNGVLDAASYKYGVVPADYGGNIIGSSSSMINDLNGRIIAYPIGVNVSGFGYMGTIADFLFTSSNIPNQTMNFEGSLCSFYRWFFPVNEMMRAR